MAKKWTERTAKAFLEKRGVVFRGKQIIFVNLGGNGGGSAYDYLVNYCGYK